MQTQTLHESSRGFAEQPDAGEEHFLERGGEFGIRPLHGERPQPARVPDDLFRDELPADFNGVERAPERPFVNEPGESLDVRGVPEERAHELEGVRAAQTRDLEEGRVGMQGTESEILVAGSPSVARVQPFLDRGVSLHLPEPLA